MLPKRHRVFYFPATMAERRGGSSIMLLLVAVTPPAVAYAPAAALLRPRTAAAVGLALARVQNNVHDNRRVPAALRSAFPATFGTGFSLSAAQVAFDLALL